MNIYMFKSETKSESKGELRAFAADAGGQTLPQQFRPWHAVGVVKTGRALPHNMSRDIVEKAIGAQGFQLWRIKPKVTA